MSSFTTQVCNPFLIANGPNEGVCFTTNGEIKRNGEAVMGAGVAKYVRDNFDGSSVKLSKLLREHGNRVFNLGTYNHNGNSFRLLTFPTKKTWRSDSSPELIIQSAEQLVALADKFGLERVYVPAPGCSNGGLLWSDVAPLLSCLDDRFIITSLHGSTFAK